MLDNKADWSLQRLTSLTLPIIREYLPEDLEGVLRLAEKYTAWDTTPTRADIEGFHSAEPDLFLVAELARAIIGFVYGRESKDLPDEVLRKRKATKAGSIEALAVAEEHRRKGIATALLNRLFKAFRQRAIDYVSLAVPEEEIGARKMYDKLGFQTRAYFMSKRL